MIDFLLAIAEPVLAGITLAVCLAVPKLWLQTIMNKKDIEEVRNEANRNTDKFSNIFERLDQMSTDVSYIRGKMDAGS